MAKEKKKNIPTPVAPCSWAFLNKPNTRWDDDGIYKINLIFDPSDEFIIKIEKKAEFEYKTAKAAMKPAKAKALKFESPVKAELDEEELETGNVYLGFKSKAVYRKGDKVTKNKIRVFDSNNALMTVVPSVGNGSKCCVAFTPIPTIVKGVFYLTLWMNAVQIIDLVPYESDGSSFGFGEHEGGFESSIAEGFDKEHGEEKDDLPIDDTDIPDDVEF